MQCYLLCNFPYFRSSHRMCSVRKGVLRNIAKFTGKHLRQSLFFNKVAGWGDCFSSFSCLLLFTCLLVSSSFLFISFQQKHKMKKGKYPDRVKIFTFLLEYRFVWRQRFQKKFDRWQFDRKMCLMGIWCCSFHG